MKSTFFAIALGLVTITTTYAQTGNQTNTAPNQEARQRATPEERADRQTKMMASTLGLSADQEAKVKALNLKRLTQIDALRESKETQANVDRNQAKTIRDNWNIELKSILTPEQYTKYEAQQGEMRGKRSRMNGSRKRS
ncbi:hypothetical protein [Adhaeribacter pallidiroseus]|uniref:DUF4890 domain-containing protein n=1 Tax=Adhaeribacter pallidiroseus TaxID=2072847 RepID=A0A369QHR0_9BACT|nr:hypothetical protein [Adhaeribacter pallidiroseus]RDC62817.1 hypothetical protein AHMF7616_01411 [Adhaeribacter pallidiroseus]